MGEATKEAVEAGPRFDLQLSGEDGNIFVIGGRFRGAARRAGWTSEQIDAVLSAVTNSRSYDDALQVIMTACEVS